MSGHLYADIACALASLLPNDPAGTFQNHIHMAPRNRGDITGVDFVHYASIFPSILVGQKHKLFEHLLAFSRKFIFFRENKIKNIF